jgi:hypothetical protein
VGARHVARMRGAFNRPRLAVSGTGQPGKPEAKPGAADATRANGAQRGPTAGQILGSSQGFFGGR